MYVHQHLHRVQTNKMKPGIGLRKGAWTAQEDMLLKDCIEKHGEGKWHLVPHKAGLNRCRKSCRLRWLNYLRPNIKRGEFGEDEVDLMLRLHKLLGNKWSLIAGRIPGRTANDVKNYWNTHFRSCSRKQKKESSKVDKSLQHVKVTIFKPQPRTFSKTVNWHMGGKPHAMTRGVTSLIRSPIDGANDFNVHSGLISSPNILDHKNNELEYLDDLLNDSEKETEDQNGWLFGGSVVDGEALNGVEQEGGQNDLCDFGIDDFTWTLFDSDQL